MASRPVESGDRVTAFTYRDDDRETPPRKVEGVLRIRKVELLGYMQFLVDGITVDPDTVRRVQD